MLLSGKKGGNPNNAQQQPQPPEYRVQILNELYNTEIGFNNTLNFAINEIFSVMLNQNLISTEDLTAIFSNLAEVRDVSSHLLELYNEELSLHNNKSIEYYHNIVESCRYLNNHVIMNVNQDIPVIEHQHCNYAKSMIMVTDQLKNAYSIYVSNYTKSCILLSRLRTENQQLHQFLSGMRRSDNLDYMSLDLEAYLILPIGRLPRYVLLFQETIRNTPNDHPHYSDIVTLVDILHNISSLINSSIQRDEEVEGNTQQNNNSQTNHQNSINNNNNNSNSLNNDQNNNNNNNNNNEGTSNNNNRRHENRFCKFM